MIKKPVLVNGLIQSLYTPKTFDIPTKEEINNIEIGNYIKIGVYTKDFESPVYKELEEELKNSNKEEDKVLLHRMNKIDAERLWFEVAQIRNDTYIGLCSNKAVKVDLAYEKDFIEFKAYNILDIDKGGN